MLYTDTTGRSREVETLLQPSYSNMTSSGGDTEYTASLAHDGNVETFAHSSDLAPQWQTQSLDLGFTNTVQVGW